MDSAASSPGALSFQERYAALARDWRRQLPERLADLAARTVACRLAPSDTEPLDELYRQVHMLAGSAGTFGLHAVGERARALEGELLRVKALAPRAPADFDGVQRALDALLAAAPQD